MGLISCHEHLKNIFHESPPLLCLSISIYICHLGTRSLNKRPVFTHYCQLRWINKFLGLILELIVIR